jgi:hypothetical protein
MMASMNQQMIINVVKSGKWMAVVGHQKTSEKNENHDLL